MRTAYVFILLVYANNILSKSIVHACVVKHRFSIRTGENTHGGRVQVPTSIPSDSGEGLNF